MKQTYTIGEVASMLRINVDAIRFYERKGLVHPQKNKENKYRIFTMNNILELLDVIYYRELDMSISEISSILHSGTKSSMQTLLREKRENAQKRLLFERQLIRKIEHIEQIYDMIDTNREVSLRQFPKTWILRQGYKKDEIMKSQIESFTKDQFVMSSVFYSYHVESQEMQNLYITMEQSIMEEFGIPWDSCEELELGTCICKVVKMEKNILQKESLADLFQCAKRNGYQYDEELYVHEIPLTSYMDACNYFAEIYLPIKEKTDRK